MIIKKQFDITAALYSLRPNCMFRVYGYEYEGIQWDDDPALMPTKEEVQAELDRLQLEHDNEFYKVQRKAEYPPIAEYLDGIVKGDEEQISTYIAACQAVKLKYPKP